MADNTFCASKSLNSNNCGWTTITQQWIVWFTQTEHQNLPLNILFTLLDSSNVIWKNTIFLLFSNFWLQKLQWCPYMGQEKFFEYLRHHLQPIPSTITTIKILIICAILLCSVQHILIKKNKNHILTFDQQKTSNKCYHSKQSPILKFRPSNCLHFHSIFPSADINCIWAKGHLYTHTPISPCKPICCLGINYSPQVNEKTKHD